MLGNMYGYADEASIKEFILACLFVISFFAGSLVLYHKNKKIIGTILLIISLSICAYIYNFNILGYLPYLLLTLFFILYATGFSILFFKKKNKAVKLLAFFLSFLACIQTVSLCFLLIGAVCFYRANEDFSSAIKCINIAKKLSIFNKDDLSYYNLVVYAYSVKSMEDINKYIPMLEEFDKIPQRLEHDTYCLDNLYLLTGQYDKVIAQDKHASSPKTSAAYLLKGNREVSKAKKEEYYKKALELERDFSKRHEYEWRKNVPSEFEMYLLKKTGDTKNAKIAYDSLVKYYASKPSNKLAIARINRKYDIEHDYMEQIFSKENFENTMKYVLEQRNESKSPLDLFNIDLHQKYLLIEWLTKFYELVDI